MTVRTLRRLKDGIIFHGLRYGGEYGEVWEGGAALIQVRDFVLGTNTDHLTTSVIDAMADIVKPGDDFQRGVGFTQISVKDPDNNVFRDVKHGQWIMRPAEKEKYLLIVGHELIGKEFEILRDGLGRIEYDKVMAKLVPSVESLLPAMDDPQHFGLARDIADKLYREGWRQK